MSHLVEVRLQIAALTLAEEQNFTRAAERLRITQPALSKRIHELEVRLGFLIFLRGQKRVELTDAGQVFVRGCRDAHTVLERAIRSAKATHDEIEPVITLGHNLYTDPELISSVLSVHLPLYPALRLRIESMFASDLVHGVLASELDMAIMSDPTEIPQLTLVHLATHPLCVVMAEDHPAARKSTVRLQELGRVGWMIFPRIADPDLYDRLMNQAKEVDASPVELHHYVALSEAAILIGENFGVAFATQGIAETLATSGLVVRPLAHGSLEVRTYLGLLAEQSSRLVNEFGRAVIRKAVPRDRTENALGQLLLKL